MRFFDDFVPGATETFGPLAVTRDDIVSFARAYDPQPFHLDEEQAKTTFVGSLIASGWHSCALNMRLVADGVLLDAASMGAPGIEEVRWLRPVRPGARLRSRMNVLQARPSRRRPELGLVQFRFDVLNQDDETVMTQQNWVMFGRRGATVEAGAAAAAAAAAAAPGPGLPAGSAVAPQGRGFYLEDLVPGEATELGAHTFTAQEIIGFARAFDPQPFHVDPDAAKRSLFGGLCASGWHTAAVWMRQMAAARDRSRAAAVRSGARSPQLGPSPGFKNLAWARPVYAGDTIAYRSTIVGTRPSASRPGWGLAFHRNSGVNQNGAEVFSFDGTVFWERRP